jgi:hypothetical protein
MILYTTSPHDGSVVAKSVGRSPLSAVSPARAGRASGPTKCCARDRHSPVITQTRL